MNITGRKRDSMKDTARALVAPGKGILAADESLPTIEKRFKALGVTSTEETRRNYRELLLRTPDLHQFITGIILFDETLRQESRDGTPLREIVLSAGLIPGIKVDKGAKPLAGFPGEKITEGLDGLRERLQEYHQLGARFSKWRAVITIGQGVPTQAGLEANAHALARYAALSQESGLVPIVEPEVLMDGSHGIQQHFESTQAILKLLFGALFEHRISLDALLLKTNMILPGKLCPAQVDPQKVAEMTLECLLNTVPAAVPGIVFLSGGQSAVEATVHLNALNQLGNVPWQLSFSFGRALQDPALRTWAGLEENTQAAQAALFSRARLNSAARFGQYTGEL